VNTGLTGGPYGTGHRISIKHTRKIIKTILNGELDKVEYYKDIDFLFMVPQNCPGVPQKILNPQLAWKNKEAYKATKRELVRSFSKNFERYKKSVDPDIERGGPTL
jgi:phosphoenolpyruvate carboxykinase (ATP)